MPTREPLFHIPELKTTEFARIRELAHAQFGLDLQAGKERLVASRLARHMASGGFSSFSQYIDEIAKDSSGETLVLLIDSLTTNHTSFMRESKHFDFLVKTALPSLPRRPVWKIWCAACSSGEEAYSIMISASQLLGPSGESVEVLATDISTRVLRVAEQGTYCAEKIQVLPEELLRKCFLRGTRESTGLYRIKPDIRKRVTFQRFNLMDAIPWNEKFPVIFCRNVMIYFDQPTQQKTVNKLADSLEPGGYLFVGHSESLTGVMHSLEWIRPAVYRKTSGQGSSPCFRGAVRT